MCSSYPGERVERAPKGPQLGPRAPVSMSTARGCEAASPVTAGEQIGLLLTERSAKRGEIPSGGRLDVRPIESQNKGNDHFDHFIQPK